MGRSRPVGPLLAGLVLVAVGVLALVVLRLLFIPARVGPARTAAPPVSRQQAVASAHRAARILFPSYQVLQVFTTALTQRTGINNGYVVTHGQQVLMILGRGKKAFFAAQETIIPYQQPLVGTTDESGWLVPFAPAASGVAEVGSSGLPAALRADVGAWVLSLAPGAALAAAWPFPSGVLAVAKVQGQTEAAFFVKGHVQVLVTPPSPRGGPGSSTIFVGPGSGTPQSPPPSPGQ